MESTLQTNSGISLTGVMAAGTSLQSTESVIVGDPPGFGSGQINGQITVGTLPWPGYPNPYIGDPPPVYDPPIKIVPAPIDIWPQPGLPWDVTPYQPTILPNTGWQPSFTLAPNPWNVTFQGDRVIARCDVPGAVLESLSVEIKDGSISVNYRRFDNNGLCYPQAQFIGTGYDPKTAEAFLDRGVLTIVVMAFAEKQGHKVTVVAK